MDHFWFGEATGGSGAAQTKAFGDNKYSAKQWAQPLIAAGLTVTIWCLYTGRVLVVER
jgi:hypothetical protein